MKTKRIVSFILAVLMLVSCMSLPTLAADATDSAKEATITVESEYAVAGSTVTLDVSIQNNPGILGMTLEVEYDETAATLVAVKNGDCLSGMTFTTPKDLASGCRLPWDAENVAEEDIKDGVIVSLTFEIAEAVQAESAIPVTLSYLPGAIIDNEMNALSVKLENGAIRVIDYIPGDLNGDGIINTTDVVLLRRYIAGGYNVTINPSAGDVNADGNLNTTDVVLIRRFVAGGYHVVLKPGMHTHTEVIDAAKAPTCTETGLTEGKHCSTCGEILVKQEVIAAKGHDFGEWAQTKAPTCTEKGAEKRSCKNCDHFETREIAMLNHEYVDNICKNCGQAEQETSSEGLEFSLNSDGKSYSVSGIGSCTDADVVIPSTYEGKPVTSISNQAFSHITSLTGIHIPDSVVTIDYDAFYGCSGLTSIEIPAGVRRIGDAAFSCCTGLTSITIPANVTSIGEAAFSGCSALMSIAVDEKNTAYHSAGNCLISISSKELIAGCNNSVIPTDGSVVSIGYCAFSNCTGLTNIGIPDSVTSIGNYAFSSCTELTRVTIGKGVTAIGHAAFEKCTSLTGIVIPNGVTSIGEAAFKSAGLTSIVIPDSVTNMGMTVFSKCKNLVNVIIGNGVTNISNFMFSDCTSLTSIVIPDSVMSIGIWAFRNCTGLERITFKGTKEQWERIEKYSDWDANTGEYEIIFTEFEGDLIPSEGLQYAYLSDSDSYAVSGIGTCTDTEVVIPSTYNGKSVTSIGNSAFGDCRSLTCIRIPNSVTSIASSAFFHCSSLTSITIPDSVTSIGYQAFIGCGSLTSINIPDSVTSIDEYTFYNCRSLASIIITNSVTSIGAYAFSACSSLTSITILGSVTRIGREAFSLCTSLTSVEIPNSVTITGDRAFAGCAGLTSITFNGTKEQWNDILQGSDWDDYTGEYTIHCTDGDIAK